MRDDRQVAAHRLEKRHAEALVLREREQRGRAAVVGDERLDRHAASERDRVAQPETLDVGAQAPDVVRRHRRGSDEVEARAAVALAVARECRDDVVDTLVRQELADRNDRGPLLGERLHHRCVGLDVERRPVDDDRNDRRAGVSELLELAAVEFAVGDAELGLRREILELAPPDLGVLLGGGVDATEVARRRDVVVDDGLAARELRDLVDGVVAHRHVEERQPGAAALAPQVAPRAGERAHLGFRLVDEDLGLHAAPPEEPLQLERVVADRVAVCQRRHDLVGDAEPLAHDDSTPDLGSPLNVQSPSDRRTRSTSTVSEVVTLRRPSGLP